MTSMIPPSHAQHNVANINQWLERLAVEDSLVVVVSSTYNRTTSTHVQADVIKAYC